MNQKKVPARKGEAKTYSYTFTLSQLVSLGGGLAVALTVFFVLGVLIGRGYRPEAEVPELARIMPTAPAPNATAQQPQVLKPEELQYLEHLTQAPAASKGHKAEDKPQEKAQDKAAEKAQADAKAKAEKDKAEDKAKAEKARAEAVAQALAEAKDKAAREKPAEKPQDKAKAQTGDEGLFDYVYQAAAFKDRDPAEALRRRIETTGLKAVVDGSTENGATWYRVNILYHGTPSSTDGMREKLASLGLGRPIMKSKKPSR